MTWDLKKLFIYIYIYIYRNNFSDHDIYSLQICFMRQNLNPQETNKYWYWWSTRTNKVQHGESFSTSQALSLSWHSSKENSWCVGKKFQFLGDGLDLQDEAFSRWKIFLEHKVCIFWSLDWRVALCPISSNSLCMLILWLYIPRCVYWGRFRACNQHSQKISCGASTLF